MHATIRRGTGLIAGLLLGTAVSAWAAGPDLRLVDAAAQQDKAAVQIGRAHV